MNYEPFDIGNRFRVIPPDTDPTDGDRIDLIMQRGAFGSGEHETTDSCLKHLEALDVRGQNVLDLGSGTGILAIAALKLGASHAVCVDIEASAVETARVNCRLNGFNDNVTHLVGTLDELDATGFDLVLANIYGDILLALAPDLASRARSGGKLLLSGILWEYNFDVRQAYERAGCEVVSNRMLPEFSTVLLRKIG